MRRNTKRLCLMALLMAIMILMGFTPLGSIPLPFMKATTTHIPVILAAILFGWRAGAAFGAGFGLISMLRSTWMPNLTSFAFSPFIPIPGTDQGTWKALLIAFVPRICIGLITAAVCRLCSRHRLRDTATYILCGIVGSLTNTVLVLTAIYFLVGNAYAAVQGIEHSVLVGLMAGVVFSNGIGEAVLGAVLVPPLAHVAVQLVPELKNEGAR